MNKALLVGINAYPQQSLNGCVNDVTDMAKFIVSKCDFKMDNVRLLVDARATKKNIIERLTWLLQGAKSGDQLMFHYSGHGVQVPTRNVKGEVDKLDEAICPVDFDWTDEHTIRDKEFHKIFSKISQGVRLTWISDSCHSGDLWKALPKTKRMNKNFAMPVDLQWRLQTAHKKNILLSSFKATAQALNLALLSGCTSTQTSADAYFKNRPNGAFTYFLLQELSKPKGLQTELKKVISNTNAALKKNDYDQQPQLEGNASMFNNAFLAKA